MTVPFCTECLKASDATFGTLKWEKKKRFHRNKFCFCLLPDDTENEVPEEDSDDEDEGDTEVKEENGVLVLTDGNYDTFMEGKDTVLVEFYAPWYVYGSSGLSLFGVVPPTSHLIPKTSPCVCMAPLCF